MPKALLLTVSLIGLAACAQPASNDASAGAAANSTAPAAAGTATEIPLGETIQLSQLPQLRAGLWEETETNEGGRPTVNTTCERGGPQDMDMGACADVVARRTLTGGFVLTANCASDGSRMRVRLHAEGDFTTRYTLDSQLVMTTGEQTITHRSRMSARHTGPCPADRRSGE